MRRVKVNLAVYPEKPSQKGDQACQQQDGKHAWPFPMRHNRSGR
jgi:hypothetical protein